MDTSLSVYITNLYSLAPIEEVETVKSLSNDDSIILSESKINPSGNSRSNCIALTASLFTRFNKTEDVSPLNTSSSTILK